MSKPRTKIVGGLMVAMLIATIGAALVSAETDEAGETEEWHVPFFDRRNMIGRETISDDLTDEQQEEIDKLIASLTEEGASSEEIREEVFAKLNEMGIFDDRLENAIEHTEKQLEILNRESELRDQGYTWEEINEIIQEEFDLDYPAGICNGFHQGIHEDYNESVPIEPTIETSAI